MLFVVMKIIETVLNPHMLTQHNVANMTLNKHRTCTLYIIITIMIKLVLYETDQVLQY